MSTLSPADLGSRPLILGTSSKYRHALFRQNFPCLPFTARAPDIDEHAITVGHTDRSTTDPSALTLALASAKAAALVPHLAAHGALLLTSDQVLWHAGRIREKPRDAAECRAYLRSYAAAPVVTVTAVVVTDTATGRAAEGVDVATQHVAVLPDAVIDALVAKGDVLHCAGGITVEDPLLAPYLRDREGALDSIMGLPVALTARLLREAAGIVTEGEKR